MARAACVVRQWRWKSSTLMPGLRVKNSTPFTSPKPFFATSSSVTMIPMRERSMNRSSSAMRAGWAGLLVIARRASVSSAHTSAMPSWTGSPFA